jgi:chromosome partitioning protein
VSATTALSGSEVNLANMSNKREEIEICIEKFYGMYEYEYIVIDCPPSLALLIINALVAAGSI